MLAFVCNRFKTNLIFLMVLTSNVQMCVIIFYFYFESQITNLPLEHPFKWPKDCRFFFFFFEQTRILNRHEFECEDSKMVLIKETKLGLLSIVHFQCSSCGKEYQIQSCFKLDGMINVNKAMSLGITSIGSGF